MEPTAEKFTDFVLCEEDGLDLETEATLVLSWMRDNLSPASASLLPSYGGSPSLRKLQDAVYRGVLNEALIRVIQDALGIPSAAESVRVAKERLASLLPAAVGGAAGEPDSWHNGELPKAAACYALADPLPASWPANWPLTFWAPTERRANLVTAAALLLLEIEQMDRAAASGSSGA